MFCNLCNDKYLRRLINHFLLNAPCHATIQHLLFKFHFFSFHYSEITICLLTESSFKYCSFHLDRIIKWSVVVKTDIYRITNNKIQLSRVLVTFLAITIWNIVFNESQNISHVMIKRYVYLIYYLVDLVSKEFLFGDYVSTLNESFAEWFTLFQLRVAILRCMFVIFFYGLHICICFNLVAKCFKKL